MGGTTMRSRIRTGIKTMRGAFNVWELCRKHKITWKEGEGDESKICRECIDKARPTRYAKPKSQKV